MRTNFDLRFKIYDLTAGLVACLLFLGLVEVNAASSDRSDRSDFSPQTEHSLIQLLKSHAQPEDKAIACKQLAICGTKNAVPALAALLDDGQLASWARIALEAIPDPAADAALRHSLPKLHGQLLVGAINSIAFRRDPKAVPALVQILQEHGQPVRGDAPVSASAIALGRIGGPIAAKALTNSLAVVSSYPPEVRAALAQGCILCADNYRALDKDAEALTLYQAVRAAAVPRQNILESVRGTILARGSAGLELLLDCLRSPDKALYGIGLRTARELPGDNVTLALAAEVERPHPIDLGQTHGTDPAKLADDPEKRREERQCFLLLALADRNDPAALPTLVGCAGKGAKKLRLTAIGLLENLSAASLQEAQASVLNVLLETAADPDTELSQAGHGAVTRLPGKSVDDEILDRLPKSNGRMHQALIELASSRRLRQALPDIVKTTNDEAAANRRAAIQAIGVLGDEPEAGVLAALLPKCHEAKERGDIETALIAISGRNAAGCTKHLLVLAENDDPAIRIITIHALSSAGGAPALTAVNAAVQDKDETVQDEAARALSTWPNNWPEDTAVAEPLLALANSGKKTSHQVLGLRGYLQFVRGDKNFKDEDKISRINGVRPLLKRPEEQRLAITAAEGISSPAALEFITSFTAEPAVTDDACSALLKIASNKESKLSKPQRELALHTVLEHSKDDDSKKKAKELLKAVK
ncbi:MAG: hypothetical protein C5B50_14535 [Verrucomicrobia bacterium]|nr:MAG: hypothetical protein C5B50_14535 [Verrucomicrobiota bacterium]